MISDFRRDYFMLYLRKKEQILDVIPPLKDFFSIYATAAFIIPATLLLMKMRWEEKKEKKRDRLKAIEDQEKFTNNSFLEIKAMLEKSDEKTTRLELEQGKMMKKEDARDEFVDNKRFDLQTESFNKRFDTIEETAKENKNDLKKTIEENKNDLKDFITQALQLIKKDK
tara:strand:+ start:5032 stop:5538 length:507 start_codon:yes stop_codon:yes gene_type:complete